MPFIHRRHFNRQPLHQYVTSFIHCTVNSINPLDARVRLVLIAQTPEGKARQDIEVFWKMFHPIDQGASYSDLFSRIGRGNVDGTMQTQFRFRKAS